MTLTSLDHSKENWSKHAVVYQIYPRSFKDTNGDGIGDLRGVIEKLDYLNDGTEDSLGVNVIWLNPIYKSPQRDFGYDVSDYYDIDPIFGDLNTFDLLVREAHKRSIKVIMDFVPNHTSDEHEWFKESRKSKNNSKRNWYIWRPGKDDKTPPNNWLSVFGGSAWQYDPKTKEYFLHTFLKDQPDLNWRNKEVKQEMENVLNFWLKRGVDGFRTDSVYHLIKDSQFRDDLPNPKYVPGRDGGYNSLIHKYSAGQPELAGTAGSFCQVIGKKENTFIVSEAYLAIPEMAELYKACEGNVHAPFNFNLLETPWSAKKYRSFIDKFDASLAPEHIPTYVFGNHDRPRLLTRLGKDQARLAAMMLFTLRGMPFIYYGEEIGMEDVDLSNSVSLDPWGKNEPEVKLGRDSERTPMQWNSLPNAGFSTVKPWLPVHENYKTVNVTAERKDRGSILNLYKRLIHFRKNFQPLIHGTYRSIDIGNDEVFVYLREFKGEQVMVMANFSPKEQKVSYGELRGVKVACSTHVDRDFGKPATFIDFPLRPYEGYIFII